MAAGPALTGAAPTAVLAGAGCSPVRARAGGARPGAVDPGAADPGSAFPGAAGPGAAGPGAALPGQASPGVARHGVAGPGRGAVAPRRGTWAPGRSAPAGVGPRCRGLASPRSSSVPRWPAGCPLRLVVPSSPAPEAAPGTAGSGFLQSCATAQVDKYSPRCRRRATPPRWNGQVTPAGIPPEVPGPGADDGKSVAGQHAAGGG